MEDANLGTALNQEADSIDSSMLSLDERFPNFR
jgi:hypothetical protein